MMEKIFQIAVLYSCLLFSFQCVILEETHDFNGKKTGCVFQIFHAHRSGHQNGKQSKLQYTYNQRTPIILRKKVSNEEAKAIPEKQTLSDQADLLNKRKDLSSQKENFFYLQNCYKNPEISSRKKAIRVRRQNGPQPELIPRVDIAPRPPPSPPFTVNCQLMGSCLINKGSYTPQCYCDTLCHIYKDCCLDVLESELENSNFLQVHSQLKPYMICHKNVYRVFGVQMINRCPENLQNVRNRCSDLSNFLPGTDYRNVTFRNSFCAGCHSGVKNFTPWSIVFIESDVLKCMHGLLLLDLPVLYELGSKAYHNISFFLNSLCLKPFHILTDHSILPRMCISEDSLNSLYPINSDCRNYMNPGLHLQTYEVFKNVQCLPTSIKNKTLCIKMGPQFAWLYQDVDSEYTIIFNFGTINFENLEMYCDDGYILNEILGLCLPVFCEPDNNTKCYFDFTIKNAGQVQKIFGITNGSIDNSYISRAVIALLSVLQAERFQYRLQLLNCDFYCTERLNWQKGICASLVCCGFDLTFEIIITTRLTFSNFVDISKIQNIVWSYNERNDDTGNVINTMFKGKRQIIQGVPLLKRKIYFDNLSVNEMIGKVIGDRLNASYFPDKLNIMAVASFYDRNTMRHLNVSVVSLTDMYTDKATAGFQYVFNIIVALLCVTVIKI